MGGTPEACGLPAFFCAGKWMAKVPKKGKTNIER
jgi:hypothetical protein